MIQAFQKICICCFITLFLGASKIHASCSSCSLPFTDYFLGKEEAKDFRSFDMLILSLQELAKGINPDPQQKQQLKDALISLIETGFLPLLTEDEQTTLKGLIKQFQSPTEDETNMAVEIELFLVTSSISSYTLTADQKGQLKASYDTICSIPRVSGEDRARLSQALAGFEVFLGSYSSSIGQDDKLTLETHYGERIEFAPITTDQDRALLAKNIAYLSLLFAEASPYVDSKDKPGLNTLYQNTIKDAPIVRPEDFVRLQIALINFQTAINKAYQKQVI